MDTSCCQANRQINAEDRLRDILNRLRNDWDNMRNMAESLACKVNGPVPSNPSTDGGPRPFPNDLNALTDAVGYELGYILSETMSALQRAHDHLGIFDGPQKSAELPAALQRGGIMGAPVYR